MSTPDTWSVCPSVFAGDDALIKVITDNEEGAYPASITIVGPVSIGQPLLVLHLSLVAAHVLRDKLTSVIGDEDVTPEPIDMFSHHSTQQRARRPR